MVTQRAIAIAILAICWMQSICAEENITTELTTAITTTTKQTTITTTTEPTTTSNPRPNTMTRDVLKYHTLHVETDTSVTFTWEAKRATGNITVMHSNDVNVVLGELRTGEFKVVAKVDQDQPSSAVRPYGSSPVFLTVTLALAFICSRHAKWQWLLFVSLYLFTSGFAETTGDVGMSSVHLVIPSDVIQKICINGKCYPVLCRLSLDSEYSNVPSNSPIFRDNNCTIKKPDRWDEWLRYYFGNESVQQTYYGDFDQDGLVNILEYYGLEAFGKRPYGEADNKTEGTRRRRRAIPPISEIGSNPTKADTDGDLLMDGFEVFNSLNPKRKDEAQTDYDKDSLSNLDEQIRQTDPLNPDSDGDGIPDGEEVEGGGDPKNPRDEGKKPPNEQTAVVRLTVGDHSGSHSERYVLHVGHISHQSPGFGLVGSGNYKFPPGTYRITLQHAGTNLNKPDYDYTAYVQKISGDARVRVEDPERMLGRHHESRYFYASGKSASLIVEANCTGEDCKCNKLKTCDQCVTSPDPECEWSIDDGTCVDKSAFNWFGYATDISECPCKKCKDWFDGEMAGNRDWLNEVNRQFPCPCRATAGVFGLNPVGAPADDWDMDFACAKSGLPLCSVYHPGAYGCLRSSGATPSGAGQQCCYGSNLNLLAPNHPGAGTPDRGHSTENNALHRSLDVEPFDWCCRECKEASYCDYYKQLRKGSNSHCNK